MDFEDSTEIPLEAGLCRLCRHAALKTTERSAFVWCRLSETDRRFPRYPRLPVFECPGFGPEKTPEGAGVQGP